ncbi:MAG: tripartite tricarboxylate transporter TctB family protein [Xanthobacteraceae bacterium]
MSEPASGGVLGHERTASRMTGAILTASALAMIAFGDIIQPGKMSGFFEPTSPALVPTVVLVALAICGLTMVVWPDASNTERFSLSSLGLKLAALLYLFVFTSLLPVVGWLIASLGLLLTMPLLAGYRKPVGIMAAAALVLGSIWLVFIVGIDAPLP